MNNTDAPEHHAWRILLHVKEILDHADLTYPFALAYLADSDEVVVTCDRSESCDVFFRPDGSWWVNPVLEEKTRSLLEFYLVLFDDVNSPCAVGHLGQSLDAKIATSSGDSIFVTGEENRKHLHRMRALCHAVVVGVNTVELDNPQLTTRSVTGRNPIRVVIDPRARADITGRVFSDQKVQTLLLHHSSADLHRLEMNDKAAGLSSNVVRLSVPGGGDEIDSQAILQLLGTRNLTRLFIEGGGQTVSRFLQAGCLNRLHLAVAPLLVGLGTPAIQIPDVGRMKDAIRAPYRLYRMGEDLLWDLDLSASGTSDKQDHSQIVRSDSEFQRLS